MNLPPLMQKTFLNVLHFIQVDEIRTVLERERKKRLMLLSATETLLYDDSLESRMTHRSVGSSPAGSVYHLYGAIWQCHQVLHKVVVHALSDLDAMCNEIIDRLPFQATWCCKCIIKRYLLEPQYAANRFA